jgi:DNA-binding beta-propeller fold protein YncE
MRILPIIAGLLVFARWTYAEEMPLHLMDHIPLTGVTGRIDHMAVDTVSNRLFVAALGNNSLEVVDLQKGTKIRTISRLREPQGVLFIAGSGRLVVSNGGNGACLVFDANTLELIKRIDLHEDADNLRYDVAAQQLFVAYGRGAIGIFDNNYERVGVIPLPGHPESFALSRGDGRMFINVPAIQAVVVADVERRQIVGTWKLRNARGNFPMALDGAFHLLLVGARDPSQLVGFDTQSGRVAFTIPIDGDPDDIHIDSQRRRAYVSCGAGYLDVLERTDSGQYQSMKKIATAPGARTSLFVSEMRRLFLAVPHRGQQEAGIWVYAVQPEESVNGQRNRNLCRRRTLGDSTHP